MVRCCFILARILLLRPFSPSAGDGTNGELDVLSDPRKALGTSCAGDDTKVNFRQANLGAFGRDPVLASQSQLQTPPQGNPLDGSNGGFLNTLENINQLVKARRLELSSCVELCNIRSGRERGRVVAACDDDGLDIRVFVGGLDFIQEVSTSFKAQRVDLRGLVVKGSGE